MTQEILLAYIKKYCPELNSLQIAKVRYGVEQYQKGILANVQHTLERCVAHGELEPKTTDINSIMDSLRGKI